MSLYDYIETRLAWFHKSYLLILKIEDLGNLTYDMVGRLLSRHLN